MMADCYLDSDAPYFASAPRHQAVELGDDVTLTCEVTGNPTPSIRWTRSGQRAVLGYGATLTLENVRQSDIGTYVCNVVSIDFPAIARHVHLVKKGVPRIISSSKQKARVGRTAELVCEAISMPEPDSITWSRDDDVIEEGKRSACVLLSQTVSQAHTFKV